MREKTDEMVQAVKREEGHKSEGVGEGRIHVSHPGVQQYIPASPQQKCIGASKH